MSRIEDALRVTAHRLPAKVGLVDGDRRPDLLRASSQRAAASLAAELFGHGVRTGDRVAIFLDKSLEAVVALYGAWRAGAVPVPINEGLRGRQVRHILDDSGSRFLISSPRKLGGRRARGDGRRRARRGRPVARSPAPAHPPSTARTCPATTRLAIILYTSGSTGRPKGVLISHAERHRG